MFRNIFCYSTKYQPQYSLKLCHFDGHDSTFVALVTQPSAGPILGLLKVVGGQQPIDHGNAARCVKPCYSSRNPFTNVIEMWGFAPDDASQDDDGIISIVECHLVGTID